MIIKDLNRSWRNTLYLMECYVCSAVASDYVLLNSFTTKNVLVFCKNIHCPEIYLDSLVNITVNSSKTFNKILFYLLISQVKQPSLAEMIDTLILKLIHFNMSVVNKHEIYDDLHTYVKKMITKYNTPKYVIRKSQLWFR